MTASPEPEPRDDDSPVPGLSSAGGKKELSEAEREQRRQASQAAAEKRRGKGSTSVPSDLNARLREPLVKIGEWVGYRDAELGRVLVEDAPKIAALLVKWANASWAPPGFVAVIRAAASALEPIDAFGRVLRVLFQRILDRRRRRPAPETIPFPEPVYGPEPEPEPERVPGPLESFEDEHRVGPTGVPDRFSVGHVEPPAE